MGNDTITAEIEHQAKVLFIIFIAKVKKIL